MHGVGGEPSMYMQLVSTWFPPEPWHLYVPIVSPDECPNVSIQMLSACFISLRSPSDPAGILAQKRILLQQIVAFSWLFYHENFMQNLAKPWNIYPSKILGYIRSIHCAVHMGYILYRAFVHYCTVDYQCWVSWIFISHVTVIIVHKSTHCT